MTVAYDGTSYAGWQAQPRHETVQQTLQDALFRVSGGKKVVVHASGRTDQGVHARRQETHFDLPDAANGRALRTGLNAVLPDDIRVLRIFSCAAEFHARRSATGKEYRYFIWNGEVLPPFERLYRTHIRSTLDTSAMRNAAKHLVGRHDFAAFAANPSRHIDSTVRTVTSLNVSKRGHEILIRVTGDGFLYRMVRSIAGLLIRVGEDTVAPSETKDILASRTRTARVPTAPPEGLYLWRVFY